MSLCIPSVLTDKHHFLPEIRFPPSISLSAGQIVCIAHDYESTPKGTPRVGPPLAVGYMTLPSVSVKRGTKGKVLMLLHAWKDELWKMGGEGTPPRPRLLQGSPNREEGDDEGVETAPAMRGKSTPTTQRKSPQRCNEKTPVMQRKGTPATQRKRAPVVQRKRVRRRGRKDNSQEGSYFRWMSETCH